MSGKEMYINIIWKSTHLASTPAYIDFLEAAK